MIVRHAPRTSAITRDLIGPPAEWGLSEHLQAVQIDVLNLLVWLQSEDGAKGRNRPVAIERPGTEAPRDEKTYGKASVSIDEMAEWLARRNPAQHPPQLTVIEGGANV